MKGTEIILRNETGEYGAFIGKEELSAAEVIKFLVVPVLLATGYRYESIKNGLAPSNSL